jgi:hypothetical protein
VADDYEVGYGRPPKGTRWAKGQSGNPSGRRRRTRSIKAIMAAQLDEKVVARQGGQVINLTMREVLVKSWMTQASKGNAPISKLLLGLMRRHGLDADAPEPDPEMDYQARKALHVALGRWLARYEKSGVSTDFTVKETRDILYAADSKILQMELPLGDPPASDRGSASTRQRPVTPRRTPEIDDDDCLY